MTRRIFTIIIILLILPTAFAGSEPVKPTIVGQKVSLAAGNDTITYIELINTHARTYDDTSFSRFTVNEADEGVIWKMRCIGIRMEDPFGKIILKNERGAVFKPVTNVIQTAENSKAMDQNGNVLYDGPATTFFLLGPDDSAVIVVSFGEASTKINAVGQTP